MSIQIERLQGTNRDTKKRQKVLQLQIRTLVEERADFLAQLQDQHREIINLKKQLGVAEKENEDLTSFEVNENIILAIIITYFIGSFFFELIPA